MDLQKLVAIGDKIDLKKLNAERKSENDKIPVYPSRVLDMKDNNVLQIAMPYYEGRVVPLAVNDKYELCIYTKGGLYKCNAIIVERFKTGNMFYMDVAVYSDLTKIQRREFYRYTYRTQVDYRIVRENVALGKEFESPEELAQSEWKNAVMLDLSGGGLRMVTSSEEEKETYIQVRFSILNQGIQEVVLFYGQILRCFAMENNPRLRDNRIEFKNVDKNLQEKVVRFIFEDERRNLSKGKK